MELTRSGIVTGWSPGAALLYGYQEEEIVGRGADVLRPPDRQAEQDDALRRVTAGGRSERYEADMVRKDGTVVRVSWTVAPIAGPAGDVAGIRAGNSLQHQHGVFDRARHGAKLVERPAERHRPAARHASIGRPQPRDSAAHGRTHDAAARLAPNREAH